MFHSSPLDTKASLDLSAIVKSKFLLNDITKLSYGKQTFNLESFHHVILLFAPKHTHFFYEAMQARYVYLLTINLDQCYL